LILAIELDQEAEARRIAEIPAGDLFRGSN